jgi:FADH2 O2-dependent halogenase
MSHAAGFVDPLFSRGMVNTMEVICALIDPLLNALATDKFDEEAFAGVDRMQQRVLDYNDNLVNGSFIAWDDFDLWNAWLRVFGLGTFLAEFRLMNALAEYSRTREESSLMGEAKDPVFSEFEDPDYAVFFRRCVELVENFEAGRVPASEAAKRIFDMTAEYEFPVLIRRDALIRADWIKEGDHMTEKNLRHVRSGFRWALTNPTTHDVVSTSETFFRWCARRPDPHLAELSEPSMPRIP